MKSFAKCELALVIFVVGVVVVVVTVVVRRVFSFLFVFFFAFVLLQTVSKRVDGLREAIEKTEAERDASSADAASSKTRVQALQAQVCLFNLQEEGCVRGGGGGGLGGVACRTAPGLSLFGSAAGTQGVRCAKGGRGGWTSLVVVIVCLHGPFGSVLEWRQEDRGRTH